MWKLVLVVAAIFVACGDSCTEQNFLGNLPRFISLKRLVATGSVASDKKILKWLSMAHMLNQLTGLNSGVLMINYMYNQKSVGWSEKSFYLEL